MLFSTGTADPISKYVPFLFLSRTDTTKISCAELMSKSGDSASFTSNFMLSEYPKSNGIPSRFNNDVIIASEQSKNKYDLDRAKNCKYHKNFDQKICVFGEYDKPGLVLYGESHASTVISSLSSAKKENIIFFINQCPVIFDSKLKSKKSSTQCDKFHEDFKRFTK